MSEKNKWALPSGAQEEIWSKWRWRAPDGSVLYLFRSFDRDEKKSSRALTSYAYCTFFRPGHPNDDRVGQKRTNFPIIPFG